MLNINFFFYSLMIWSIWKKKKMIPFYNRGPLCARSDFWVQQSESERSQISESLLLPVIQTTPVKDEDPTACWSNEKSPDKSAAHGPLFLFCWTRRVYFRSSVYTAARWTVIGWYGTDRTAGCLTDVEYQCSSCRDFVSPAFVFLCYRKYKDTSNTTLWSGLWSIVCLCISTQCPVLLQI